MSQEFPKNIEKQFEVEPELRYIKVYRVRHGKSVYHEHTKGRDNVPEDELDLTPEGESQIENAAEVIGERINPERDVVVIVSSPRIRTNRGSKSIIERKLKERFKDQDVVQTLNEDDKYKRRQEFFASVNLVDENGEMIKTDDPRYPELFDKQAARLIEEAKEKNIPTSGLLALNPDEQYGQFEKTSDLNQRVRQHLARLVIIARIKQPELAKKGKRLVIIELEHNETLDEMYEKASGGKYSLKTKTEDGKGTGAVEGEVLELLIPSDKNSNEIKVNFLGEGRDKDEKTITFDIRKKEFGE